MEFVFIAVYLLPFVLYGLSVLNPKNHKIFWSGIDAGSEKNEKDIVLNNIKQHYSK